MELTSDVHMTLDVLLRRQWGTAALQSVHDNCVSDSW
jgi:hypothetical protein